MILAITMNPAIDKIYFVDAFRIDEVHRPKDMIASAGGKGLNVARVAKLIGEDVAASGFLGGSNGDYISHKIGELGIDNRFVKIVEETRICINITDVTNKTCTEMLEPGPTITEEEIECFLQAFEDMIRDVQVITISGSLPKGIPTDFYAKLISLAHKQDKKVLLDTSSSALIEGIRAKPFLIKPNQDELKDIYDGPTESMDDLIKAIDYFRQEGIKMPIISLGKDGSLVGLEDGIYKVSFPPISITNSVGSGDSFIAGCAVGITRKLQPTDILKLATACGSANTQYSHTGYVEQEKVDEFYQKVNIEKVKSNWI